MKFILILLIIAFGFGSIYARHIFSVSYNGLSQENREQIKMQAASFTAPIEAMSMTRNRSDRNEYVFSFQSVQNTQIIILNEETGRSVVITPTEYAPAHFRLSPFFLEELRLAVLGDAERYLVLETGTDLSIRNIASVSAPGLSRSEADGQVFIPRIFYGSRENQKEALPRDRQIIGVFREKPMFRVHFPNGPNPESLRLLAEWKEEMAFNTYVILLPDGSKITHSEHLAPRVEGSQTNTSTSTSTNRIFSLTDTNLTGTALATTVHAFGIWSNYLDARVHINISVNSVPMSSTPCFIPFGGSLPTPNWFNPETRTWYPAPLANQLRGYNIVPDRFDIYLRMNSYLGNGYSWHYSVVGNPSDNQIDWLTVILHEITHGLGFVSLINEQGRYRYGRGTIYGQVGLTDFPCIFTRQLYQGSTGRNITSLTQAQRASLITSVDDLYAGRSGSRLLAANDGRRVRMYAPADWADRSSVSHWCPDVDFTTFMRPYYLGREHTIDRRDIAILRDIGWNIHCPTPVIVNLINQTISANRTVESNNHCGSVNVQNVTITNNAKLTIRTNYRTTISGSFSMQPGTSLSVR